MRILMSQADVTAAEQEAVSRAVLSGWVTPLGPEVDAFEAELAGRVGVDHALALSSGTAASAQMQSMREALSVNTTLRIGSNAASI